MDISQPSKHRAFLSRHKHHIIQCGINPQISPDICLFNLGQQCSKSITLLGITQTTPNMEKAKSQISCASKQWRRRWSTDSPSLLHMLHQSRTYNLLLRRLSVVRILPREIYMQNLNLLPISLTFGKHRMTFTGRKGMF